MTLNVSVPLASAETFTPLICCVVEEIVPLPVRVWPDESLRLLTV